MFDCLFVQESGQYALKTTRWRTPPSKLHLPCITWNEKWSAWSMPHCADPDAFMSNSNVVCQIDVGHTRIRPQLCVIRCFFLSLLSCNFDNQLSKNFHRFVILCIDWSLTTTNSVLLVSLIYVHKTGVIFHEIPFCLCKTNLFKEVTYHKQKSDNKMYM